MQLWTIHAMMRSGTQHKQVPLAYVLMSRRQRKDYEKVLQFRFKDILKKQTRVLEFICDFEKAVWQSVRIVFGAGVQIIGSGFNWTQCLFRQLKKSDLCRTTAKINLCPLFANKL